MNRAAARHHAGRFVRALLPRRKAAPEWEYLPGGWQMAQDDAPLKGWDVASVRDAYVQNWPQFVSEMQGKSPFGRGDAVRQTVILAYAYALARAASGQTTLSMLDWGGGIGAYCLLTQTLFPDLALDYHCKDVPVLAEYGRTLFPEAHFYADDTCFAQSYPFVLASCSLHYSRDWRSVLSNLADASTKYVFITRQPFCQHAASYAFVQRAYRYGYDTEYVGWCLNQNEFLTHAKQAGLTLVREFLTGEKPVIVNAPEQCEYRGFLFQKDRESG